MKFGTKVEIFSPEPKKRGGNDDGEDTCNQHQVNQSQNGQQQPEQSASEEENKKTYTALLQNQVLGIDNPFLLQEIHNIDEISHKDRLYSYQMQREDHDQIGMGLDCGGASAGLRQDSTQNSAQFIPQTHD